MHKRLIIDAFEKAGDYLKSKGQKNPSKVAMAETLSDYVENHTNTCLGERSFRDYYTEAKKVENKTEDVNITQFQIVEVLCHYLGYDNYETFINKDKPAKKYKYLYRITFFVVLVLGVLIFYLGTDNKAFMEWKEDHYEKTSFDAEKLSQGILKVYKEDRVINFKKIDQPDCNTVFFNPDGSVNAWYGKNTKGDLEIFTSFGLHPETGKTLKPITVYMIKKYICERY